MGAKGKAKRQRKQPKRWCSFFLLPPLFFLSLPHDLGKAVGLIHSSASLGFGKAERKHSQGRPTEEKTTGKMLQVELLQQKQPQVQKGLVAASLPTML